MVLNDSFICYVFPIISTKTITLVYCEKLSRFYPDKSQKQHSERIELKIRKRLLSFKKYYLLQLSKMLCKRQHTIENYTHPEHQMIQFESQYYDHVIAYRRDSNITISKVTRLFRLTADS